MTETSYANAPDEPAPATMVTVPVADLDQLKTQLAALERQVAELHQQLALAQGGVHL